MDTDLVLHRLVTPDVLFNAKGELRLVTSRKFQDYLWSEVRLYWLSWEEFLIRLALQALSRPSVLSEVQTVMIRNDKYH
jgi:hypothetical protein